jgi:hypothetical protein
MLSQAGVPASQQARCRRQECPFDFLRSLRAGSAFQRHIDGQSQGLFLARDFFE